MKITKEEEVKLYIEYIDRLENALIDVMNDEKCDGTTCLSEERTKEIEKLYNGILTCRAIDVEELKKVF